MQVMTSPRVRNGPDHESVVPRHYTAFSRVENFKDGVGQLRTKILVENFHVGKGYQSVGVRW